MEKKKLQNIQLLAPAQFAYSSKKQWASPARLYAEQIVDDFSECFNPWAKGKEKKSNDFWSEEKIRRGKRLGSPAILQERIKRTL